MILSFYRIVLTYLFFAPSTVHISAFVLLFLPMVYVLVEMTYFLIPQLISKFIMGAVFYNQVVDNYLDEKLSADKKPNDKPYKKGAAYTGKEHSWD